MLRLLALRDVVDKAGEDAVSVDPSFADRQFDRKGVSVTVARRRYPADPDNFSNTRVAIALEVSIVPLAIRRRHEHRYVFTRYLCFGVAEELFSSGTEREDDSHVIDDDHCVGHSREDRPQMGFGARNTKRLQVHPITRRAAIGAYFMRYPFSAH